MKYYILTNYLTTESFEVESTLANTGFDWAEPTVKNQKALLKKFGMTQRGGAVILVEQGARDLIQKTFPKARIEEAA